MAFDEGFGGMAGADKEYWRLRIKEEKAKHRSNHNSIKPGLSYKRDLETEGRFAALECADKSGKITDDERAEYEALKDVKKKADATDLKDVFRTPDTTVFTHFNENVRTFFELGGYRAFPEVVSVHVEVREVFAVDVSRGTFRVSFIATTRWYDQFFDKSEYFDKEEMYSQTRPYITFDHVDEGVIRATIRTASHRCPVTTRRGPGRFMPMIVDGWPDHRQCSQPHRLLGDPPASRTAPEPP